jgi:excisionase family DNA binding protein
MENQEWLSPEELAAILKVSRHHVVRLARQGKISSLKIGKLWRFRLNDVLGDYRGAGK